jgi:hypothetical protein
MQPKTSKAGHRGSGEPAPNGDRLSGTINQNNTFRAPLDQEVAR